MKCIECDREIDFALMEPTKTQMRTRQLCFYCNFWHEREQEDNKAPERFAIVNARHYIIGTEDLHPDACRGFSGSKFHIQFHDGRRVTSTNLWHQGLIPEHYRSRMPDNAVFAGENDWLNDGPPEAAI